MITVERGLRSYMARHSGSCRVLVRNADDPDAAAEALRRFRDELFTSNVFAPVDGGFGRTADGSSLGYEPSFASPVELGAEGPELWFDAQDVLSTWPDLTDRLIDQLRQRLEDAGVRQAEIGTPKESQ